MSCRCVTRMGRHLSLFFETILPQQTVVSLAWLFAAAMGVTWPIHLGWELVPLCIVVMACRAIGMCWNRLVDRHVDAANLRTKDRPLPSGRLSVRTQVNHIVFVAAIFFVGLCFLPPIALVVSMTSLCGILIYSFLKRITAFCHVFLGLIHGLLPIVGSIWQVGKIEPIALALSATAVFSVSSCDIVYATLDREVDLRIGLKSIPSLYGEKISLGVAFCLHVFALASMAWFFVLVGLSFFGYAISILATIILFGLWWELLQGASAQVFFRRSLYLFSLTSFGGVFWGRLWNT